VQGAYVNQTARPYYIQVNSCNICALAERQSWHACLSTCRMPSCLLVLSQIARNGDSVPLSGLSRQQAAVALDLVLAWKLYDPEYKPHHRVRSQLERCIAPLGQTCTLKLAWAANNNKLCLIICSAHSPAPSSTSHLSITRRMMS
jgi:hypothetical protein